MRILIVDDSAIGRTAVRELLASQGHGVAEAVDAATAMELAASFQPDLVLVDVLLGGESGIVAARLLAEAGVAAPVVLMSVDPVPASDVAAAGARAFVAKERLAAVDLPGLVAQ